MATVDLSRAAFNPRKHYDSLRMQMGGVLSDDDYNENERIDHEDRRRARVEIVGPAGSSDDGFRIANPRVDATGQIDFDILAGSFYLGGLRLEQDATEPFRTQRDWLQGPIAAPSPPGATRTDLAVLLTYQQATRAVEDGELFEVALGGPEPAARIRTVQRVLLLKGVAGRDCAEAWADAVADWAAAGRGTLSDEHELVPDVTLTVSFDQAGVPDDLCSPPVAGGYLGALNQAIRVQLVDPTHLTWGFDNASPLYRVTAAADRATLTFVTEPRDQASWPLAGQIVEVLPWASVLPNNEKTAELVGHLARVQSSFNPDTGQITLATPIPGGAGAGFDDWTSRPDSGDLNDPGVHYYLRVWNRGADLASDPAVAFVPGQPLTLGHTGLRVTIDGPDRVAADHWIIAARPETPDQIVPWDFETGRRPHGVRRFVAPLGLIEWAFDGRIFEGVTVHDCRPTFSPLTRRQGCCSVTVGDGRTSRGDVDQIEEALDRLPVAGGTICLLPGTHSTNAVVAGRRNVRIQGCSGRTRVVPRRDRQVEPIFTVVDSSDVTFEHLELVSFVGSGIVAGAARGGGNRRITVERCRLLTGLTAIDVDQTTGLTVGHATIRLFDRAEAGPAIRLRADDALIERCDLGVVPAGTRPPRPPGDDDGDDDRPDPADPCADPLDLYAWPLLLAYAGFYLGFTLVGLPETPRFLALGGIEVGAGSERVAIRDNRIAGGAGNGVTLGSLPPTEEQRAAEIRLDREAEREAERERRRRAQVQTLKHPGGDLLGLVVTADDGQPAPGIYLWLRDVAGSSQAVMTDGDGRFNTVAESGRIAVELGSPGYTVASTAFDRETWTHTITLDRLEPAPEETPDPTEERLAFLYEIAIERNAIAGMGLCGVGSARAGQRPKQAEIGAFDRFFYLFGSVVIGLQIDDNEIFSCLQNPFDDTMLLLGRRAGLGGISLGLAEDLRIRGNRIARNGRRHIDPVCGIYVGYAEDADLSGNAIADNGPLVAAGEGEEITQGLRGGIVVGLAASFSMVDLIADRRSPGMSTRPAIRLHDNVVDQPVGRALTVTAYGPVSVVGNAFATRVAVVGPPQTGISESAVLETLQAGAVQIIDLGRSPFLAALGADYTTLATSAAFAAAETVQLPNGNVLFNSNQTQLGQIGLGRTGGLAAFAARDRVVCAQLIFSFDDIGFDGNQSDIDVKDGLFINTWLLGVTVRASDNRLKEV